MTSSARSVHRFAHQAMGTFFEVVTAGEEQDYAGQGAAAVFKEVDRIERLFSRFDPASEIGQINRLRPGDSLTIGFETFECLEISEHVRAETAGAFDVNVRKAIEPGRTSEFRGLTPAASSSPFELHQTTAGYELRAGVTKIYGVHPLDLDLGGVGKGYALDRALEVLKDWGMGNALIHGGTSTALGIGPGPSGEVGRSASAEDGRERQAKCSCRTGRSAAREPKSRVSTSSTLGPANLRAAISRSGRCTRRRPSPTLSPRLS